MKTITITLGLLISILSFGTNNGYNQAMGAALNQFKSAKTVEDFKETANSFHRISGMAKEEWLPKYYHAQCYILMSFVDHNADAITKDQYLDEAELSINSILVSHPGNDEAFALQSFMYTGRLVIDPMTRGREFSIKSGTSIQKSLAINPTNPRALYLQLSNEVGAASFFGKDPIIYCERIQALLANWESYNKSPEMHPKWGKSQVAGLAKNCTSKNDSTVIE